MDFAEELKDGRESWYGFVVIYAYLSVVYAEIDEY